MYIQGNPKITLIQGDSYTREIEFEGLSLDLIEEVYFTCSKLSICKKLEKDLENNLFRLTINSDETNDLEIGAFDFDLTVKFIDDQTKTIQYRSVILVLEKVNKVVCYE